MIHDNIEIIGRDGRRRRMRRGEKLADGERAVFPMTVMDHQVFDHFTAKFGDATRRVIDAAGDLAGDRPGFCYSSANARLHDVADQAYEQMRLRLDAKTRKRRRPDDEDDEDEEDDRRHRQESERERRQRLARKAAEATMGTDARQPTLDELRAAADQAYEERNRRMTDAWRTRHGT